MAVTVTLQPLINKTDIIDCVQSQVLPGDTEETIFASTLPGKILAISPSGTVYTWLDITSRVLHVPFAIDGDYGFLGFQFGKMFKQNGYFYLWYALAGSKGTAVSETPIDVCNILTYNQTWNESIYHHLNVFEEWQWNGTGSSFVRRLLTEKHPTGFNQGSCNIRYANDLDTMLLAIGCGDNFGILNLAEDEDFFQGKIVSVDVNDNTWDETTAVARFSELTTTQRYHVYPVAKGLRNIVGVVVDKDIKWIGLTGEDTCEQIVGFQDYVDQRTGEMVNFGWRAWEGVYPTLFNDFCASNTDNLISATVTYYQQSLDLAAKQWRPAIAYFHNDKPGRISSYVMSGISVYKGNAIPELKGSIVFSDFSQVVPQDNVIGQGVLGYSFPNRDNLIELQDYSIVNVNYTFPSPKYFYSFSGTNANGKRMFVAVTTTDFFVLPNIGSLYEIVHN